MILADSNLIIYAASGNYPSRVKWFAENEVAVSAVSRHTRITWMIIREGA